METNFHLRYPAEFSADDVAHVREGVTQWRAEIDCEMATRPDLLANNENVAIAEPVLSADRQVLTVTLSGQLSYFFVKFFAETFPFHIYHALPLSVRLELDLGRSEGTAPPTWRSLFSEKERRSIERVRHVWSDAVLESVELHYGFMNDRPPLKATVEPDGWTECPYCGIRFSTSNVHGFANNVHWTCGQRLALQRDGP